MDTAELDEICKALEPRPGNDSWDMDPEFAIIEVELAKATVAQNGAYDSRIDGVSSKRVFALPGADTRKIAG